MFQYKFVLAITPVDRTKKDFNLKNVIIIFEYFTS